MTKFRFQPLAAGSHRYARYPRTGELKRTGPFTPRRPQKFDTWLTAPLTVTAGRYRRLRRELHRKPLKAERMLVQRQALDKAIAEKLGLV